MVAFVFPGCAPRQTLVGPGEDRHFSTVLEKEDVGRDVVVSLVDGGTRTGKLLDYSMDALVLQGDDNDSPELIRYEDISKMRIEGPWRLDPVAGVILAGVMGSVILFMATAGPWKM